MRVRSLLLLVYLPITEFMLLASPLDQDQTQLSAPVVNPLTEGALVIAGQATPKAKVMINILQDKTYEASADDVTGAFSVKLGTALQNGFRILVRQQLGGVSSPARELVVGAVVAAPRVEQLREDQTEIRFTKALPESRVDLFLNNQETVLKSQIAGSAGEGRFVLDRPLEGTDVVYLRQTSNGIVSAFAEMEVIPVADLSKPMLIGLAPFGIVASQQANDFSQTDPFGGFIVGYRSHSHRTEKDALERRNQKKEKCERDCTLLNDSGQKADCSKKCSQLPGEDIPIEIDEIQVNSLNIRVQGMFQSAPRTASQTESSGTQQQQQQQQPLSTTAFISSRKSFDVDLQVWYEIPFLRSQIFWAGPYGAVGGSALLDRNELQGEPIPDLQPSTAGTTVTTTTKNDVKRFWELGTTLSFYKGDMDNQSLYIQTILAYGDYEGLAGLVKGKDTSRRFIGRLRVFPTGLDRSFFARGVAAPVFGVDLNAGRGDDHLKFFFGMTFNITRMIGKLQGE